MTQNSFSTGANPPPSNPSNDPNCVVAFEHGNFSGNAYNFCPGKTAPNFKDWNDKISSIRISEGKKVQVCKNVAHDSNGNPYGVGPCRFYFKSVSNLGDFMNDSISYIKYGNFNNKNFTIFVSSDPQLPWACQAGACKGLSETDQGKLSNNWQVNSLNKVSSSLPFEQFAGLIINGDITAFGHDWHLPLYTEFYESKVSFNVWPGLGNHDYGKNNVNDCLNNNCAARMMYYLKDQVRSLNVSNFDLNESGNYYKFPNFNRDYSGSFAYSFDIGKYHFIQLNNYPTYNVTFNTWNFGGARRDYFKIAKANDWIKNDLAKNKDKLIILNMHNVGGGDGFLPNERTEFYKLLEGSKLVAIFGGHYHGNYGFYGNQNVGGKNIPILLAGSSEYSKYLKVDFYDDRIEVRVIDSTNGGTSFVGNPYVIRISTLYLIR